MMKRLFLALSSSTLIYSAFSANLTREIALELLYNSGDTLVIPGCYDTIDEGAFEKASFENLVIPGTVKTIKYNAFAGCDFKCAILREGVERIEAGAFSHHVDAFKIRLPISLKLISHDAFGDSVVDIYSDSRLAMRLDGNGNTNFYRLRDSAQDEWWRQIHFDKKLFASRPLVKSEVRELCAGYEQLDIPDDYTIIGKYVFSDNNRLIGVNIPYTVTRINVGAFFACMSLQYVYLSSNLERIENDVFSCCTSLESIYIPNSVRYIGNNVFYGCIALKTMRIPHHFNVTYRGFIDYINDKTYVAVYINDVHIGRFSNLTIRQAGKVRVISDGQLEDEINV